MQATGRQPQRASNGASLHYEHHGPEQPTLSRLMRQHAARFIAHTEPSIGSELPWVFKDQVTRASTAVRRHLPAKSGVGPPRGVHLLKR